MNSFFENQSLACGINDRNVRCFPLLFDEKTLAMEFFTLKFSKYDLQIFLQFFYGRQ